MGFLERAGEYTITASYTVHTGLPSFPFSDDKKPVGKPQHYEVTTPPVKVQVVLEEEALGPGDHARIVLMGEQKRTCLIHVPATTTQRSLLRSFWRYTERRWMAR
ncbi:MAG: hypothetical protein R3C12_07810 [Planctomycetaceae bacterium]